MNSWHIIFTISWLFFNAISVHAQTSIYQPLGTWSDPQLDAFKKWNSHREIQSQEALVTKQPESRPQLAGLRDKHLELLQDALKRKSPNRITTDTRAQLHMLRMIETRNGKNVLNGAMAEAIFAQKNPDWHYVRKPNAPQHDFTQVRPGGGRNNAQIKFHENGDPSRYMQDMKSDWQATKFVVPDDHVQTLKKSWHREYEHCKASGDIEGAKQAARHFGRVEKIGANSIDILQARDNAIRSAAKERYSTYVSFGASLAMAIGPTAWDWTAGNMTGDKALYHGTRALSLLGVGVGTDSLLLTIRQGALRGTVRGNVIVGTAITITEVTWLLYEHGWSRAFYQPSFYESVVGGVSGVSIGLAGGVIATAAAAETGPLAPVIGSVVGVATGTVAYIGGRSAARALVELFAPEMFQQQERQQLEATKARINLTITKSQEWPPR